MARWRNPELEALFGGPIDETGLTEAAVRNLVLCSAHETEVLDFKDQPYPGIPKAAGAKPAWTPEQELCKDVTAFANHRGGLLLLGVHDTNGVADDVTPILGDPEAEEQRLRAALANYAAPLPEVWFVRVPLAAGGWVCAAVIPPSRRAPHAVLGHTGDGRKPLHYALRHGADTIWLTESEVADRYRARFDRAGDDATRAGRVVADGLSALQRTTGLWLYAAVIPELALPAVADAASFADTNTWYESYNYMPPLQHWLRAAPRGLAGPGKVTFTGSRRLDVEDEGEIREAYLELAAAGHAFAATQLVDDSPADGEVTGMSAVQLVDDALPLVDITLSWAAYRVGGWGTATVVVGLEDINRPAAMRPLELRRLDGRTGRVSGTRVLHEQPQEVTAADLSAVGSVQERLGVAAQALTGLLQWFGLPACAQIRPDGTLVSTAWGSVWKQAEAWAEQHGVPHIYK